MHGTPRVSTRQKKARHGNDAERGSWPHEGPAADVALRPGRRGVGRATHAEDSFVDHRDNADRWPREFTGHACGRRQRNPSCSPLRYDPAAGQHRAEAHAACDRQVVCRLIVGRQGVLGGLSCQRTVVATDRFIGGGIVCFQTRDSGLFCRTAAAGCGYARRKTAAVGC